LKKKSRSSESRSVARINDGFFDRVYDIVRCIPEGRVTSYGAIAKYLGSGQSARMVGWAMNSAHTPGY